MGLNLFTQGATPTVVPAQLTVADVVYREILDALYSGRVQPGDRLHDGELAGLFGVSRTPVREAIQRLREVGLVEAAPGRFTRVSSVNPSQTKKALGVLVILLHVVVDEVVPTLGSLRQPDPSNGESERGRSLTLSDRVRGCDARPADTQQSVMRLFQVLDTLRDFSDNTSLRKALKSADHQVRFGLRFLDAPGGQSMASFINDVTDDVIEALMGQSALGCHAGLDRLATARMAC